MSVPITLCSSDIILNGVALDAPTLKAELSQGQADIVTLQGDVTTIQGDITTAQGDITTLQGDVTTAQGAITTIQGEITIIDAAITNLQDPAITVSSISGLDKASISVTENMVFTTGFGVTSSLANLDYGPNCVTCNAMGNAGNLQCGNVTTVTAAIGTSMISYAFATTLTPPLVVISVANTVGDNTDLSLVTCNIHAVTTTSVTVELNNLSGAILPTVDVNFVVVYLQTLP